MTCERCDEPAFPGRGFCAEHLLESLGLEHDATPEERELNRRCIARGRDGARCRRRYAHRETKFCAHHQGLLDEGVDFEDVLRGDLPERAPAARAEAVPTKKPRGKNGKPPLLADVGVTEEEHERVESTVGDILRQARSTSREAIEETVALLLDARRTVTVAVPAGALPGQVIGVQVPDLKLRLDGLKFVSERVEGKSGRGEVDVLRELPDAVDLGGVGAAAVQVQVRVRGAGDDPQHRADDRVERPAVMGGVREERDLDGESPLRAR